MRNKLIILFVIAIALYSCTHEKNIQVEAKVWVLTKKIPAYRYGNEDTKHNYIWLVWKTKEGDTYWERIPDFESSLYPIGRMIVNRDRR